MTNASVSTQPPPPLEPATAMPPGGANSTPVSQAAPGPKQSGPPSPERMSQGEKDLLKVLGERRLSPVHPSPELPAILGELETLTDTERLRYQACEAIVATGWQNFVDIGLALAEIRRDRLYKEEYDSFDVYCREKWHYGRRHVYQLISAAELFTRLCAICAHCKPDHESQLRPLVGLTAEQAQLPVRLFRVFGVVRGSTWLRLVFF